MKKLRFDALFALPLLLAVGADCGAQTRRPAMEIDDAQSNYAVDPRGAAVNPAQVLGPGMGMGLWRMIGILGELKLNPEQHERVVRLRRELRDAQMKLIERMWEETDTMDRLYAFGKPDPEKISDVYARIFAMQRELIENSASFRRQLMDILDEEQRATLKEYGPAWTSN